MLTELSSAGVITELHSVVLSVLSSLTIISMRLRELAVLL